MPCSDPSIIFSSKGNKISGFEINQERVSLGILGDFRIMKWKPGNTLPKALKVNEVQILGPGMDPAVASAETHDP